MGTAMFLTRIAAQIPQLSSSSEKLPHGRKVVLELLSYVSFPPDHAVFFDNYLTSYDLLVKLKDGDSKLQTLYENIVWVSPLYLPVNN